MNRSGCLRVLVLVCVMSSPLFAIEDVTRLKAQAVDQPILTRCMSILRTGLNSEEFWPSMHAAEALTYANAGSEVISVLRPKLPVEKDDQRRCGLARELYRAGDESHLQILQKILADKSSMGRTHAAESLYKIGKSTDLTVLRDALAQTESIPLQIMSAAVLMKANDSAATEFVRGQLASTDTTARNLSAWVLGRQGHQQDAKLIGELLNRELMGTTRDEMSITFLAVSLASIGEPKGRQMLVDQLNSPNPAARAMAAEFAGLSRTTEALDKLKGLLDDTSLDVQIRAAQSILELSRDACR